MSESKVISDKELKAMRFKEANRSVIPGQVVFAGSSLMEMFPINKLLEEHGDDTVIYNRGIGGFVSQELLDNIDTCILDLHPSRVFINIGTNDLSNPDIPIQQLMDTYDAILTAIEEQNPQVEIYLMAYYPVNYEAAEESMKECLKVRTNEKIITANAEVEKLAAKHNQKYIDINRNLKDEQGRLKAEYTIEGLHIKDIGYQAIYDDIMVYVKEPHWK